MIRVQPLQREDALSAIEAGEFPAAVRQDAAAVAIILSQSWCPEWKLTERYLDSLNREDKDGEIDASVFYLIYDRADFFERFRIFKEEVLGNDRIPYIRFYRHGLFQEETNFIGKHDFLALLKQSI